MITKSISKTLWVATLVLIASISSYALDYTNCELCHKEGGPAAPAPPGLLRSTHGSFVSCLDCHPGASEAHSKGTGALTCYVCHDEITESYAKSAHRMGTVDGPTCYTCHGYGHNVHPLSYAGFKPEYAPAVCMDCHGGETNSFIDSGCSQPETESGMVLGCYHCHGPVHEIGGEGYRKHELAKKRLDLCAECHSDGEGKMGIVNIWRESVHSSVDEETGLFSASCDDCHIPHDSRLPSLLTPLTLFINAHNSCKECHEDEFKAFTNSVHGEALANGSELAPDCIDCHGGHEIGTATGWSKSKRIVQCVACHDDDTKMYKAGVPIGRAEKYLHTFHGKANFYDFEDAADCVDCHTSHFILPETDPKSSVHEDNLLATCSANECHPDANESFVLAGGHLMDSGEDADPVQKWTAFFFTWLTRGVIFLLILHMAAEFTRDFPAVIRERRERKKRNKGNGDKKRFVGLKKFLKKVFPFLPVVIGYADDGGGKTVEAVLSAEPVVATRETSLKITRFNTIELLQHWVMLITFIILMFTGLPLKFPDVAWAVSLYEFFGGIEIARIIHRAAGVVMVGDFIFHVIYVAIQYLRTKGKFKALLDPSKTLAPLPKDVADLLHNILYILRIRNEPPRFGRFSYKEKFDYWAVFWGMFIMGGSGLILMYPVTFSQYLPGWLIPIAMIGHSDEAVLAILAIVIWHFYNVHFNPKKFPMNQVWLTGTLTEEEMEEEHPIEYEIKKERGDWREERIMK